MRSATAAILLLAAVAGPTRAEDSAPGGPTRAEIERVIQQQQARKSGAVTGIVLGAVAIFGGIVVSAVRTANEVEDKEARGDYSDTKLDWTGTLIGLAVGVPSIAIGATTLADANRELRRARHQRFTLGFAPEPGRERLTLAFAFGG